MSKSYKKTSISGCSAVKSEKKDKQLYNRKLRRITKQMMLREVMEELVFPTKKEIQDVWLMPKDGKSYFDKNKFPELMRK